MGWMKIENTMPEHPKVLAAGPAAAWLHVCALAYCDRHLTDGHIPSEFISNSVSLYNAKANARKLVSVGLWRKTEAGYEIHDYLDHQRSRAEVEAQREATATRVKRHRNAKRNGVTNAVVTPVRVEKRREEETTTPPNPLFEEWLTHHEETTGMRQPKAGTKNRLHISTMFSARCSEGHELEDLKLATVGAFNDEHRNEHGYYDPESVLRPTKVHKLIELGRRERRPKSPRERHAKVTLLGVGHQCRRCEATVTNEQANNQSGMCDDCYEAHVEALTGEVA